MTAILYRHIQRAADRLAGVASVTPVLTFHELDDRAQATVFCKCENFQRTGSFKFRGAYNAVTSLPIECPNRTVVTVSSGNHGHALALAAALHGRGAEIYAPGAIAALKRANILRNGARLIEAPDRAAAEAQARARAAAGECLLIHPFNDPTVIAGQGTCAREFLQQVADLDVLLAPIGGGGLLSGTCVAAHAMAPSVQVYACEPTGALDAMQSLREGRVVPMVDPTTIADGLRSSLGPLTREVLQAHLVDCFPVDEMEIIEGLRFAFERLKLVIEPSSAVVLAPLLRQEPVLRGRRVGVILSGGNLDLDRLAGWLGTAPEPHRA